MFTISVKGHTKEYNGNVHNWSYRFLFFSSRFSIISRKSNKSSTHYNKLIGVIMLFSFDEITGCTNKLNSSNYLDHHE